MLEHHLQATPPLSLTFAIPDHPWVDTGEGADVRIAMSVAAAGMSNGMLQQVVSERQGGDGGRVGAQDARAE